MKNRETYAIFINAFQDLQTGVWPEGCNIGLPESVLSVRIPCMIDVARIWESPQNVDSRHLTVISVLACKQLWL